MAIIDAELEFSDNQTVTDTALSTNVVDLIAEGAGRSMNDQLWLVVTVGDTAVSGGTVATVDVSFMTHTTATVSSGHKVFTQQFAVAELTANQKLVCIKMPQRFYNSADDVFQALEQFVGVYYEFDAAGGAGSFNAYLTHDIDAPFSGELS